LLQAFSMAVVSSAAVRMSTHPPTLMTIAEPNWASVSSIPGSVVVVLEREMCPSMRDSSDFPAHSAP
jgi:hypothetical protein